jgi:hypothetical protein
MLCLFIFTSCWFDTYRVFELPNKDNYGREKLFSDSLIDLEIWVSAYDYDRNISVAIEGSLKKQSEFMFDSISVNIIFPQNEPIEANYKLTNIGIYRNDTVISFWNRNYNTFKDISVELKTLNKVNKWIKYDLAYWDFSRSSIPKTVKKITLEIFVKYNLDNTTNERDFIVYLKPQKERVIQHFNALRRLNSYARRNNILETPADNERFCESGGVCPPEHLCEFASSPPAQVFVKPPPSQSRHHVVCNR